MHVAAVSAATAVACCHVVATSARRRLLQRRRDSCGGDDAKGRGSTNRGGERTGGGRHRHIRGETPWTRPFPASEYRAEPRQKRCQARQMAQRLASANLRRLVLCRDESVRSCRSIRGQCYPSLSDTSIQRRRVEIPGCIICRCGYLQLDLHHILCHKRRGCCLLRKIRTLTTVRCRKDGPTRAETKRCANWTTDRAEHTARLATTRADTKRCANWTTDRACANWTTDRACGHGRIVGNTEVSGGAASGRLRCNVWPWLWLVKTAWN